MAVCQTKTPGSLPKSARCHLCGYPARVPSRQADTRVSTQPPVENCLDAAILSRLYFSRERAPASGGGRPLQYTKLGDYEIVRLIGQGGMGAVYEGLNPLIGRSVAIKVLLPEYAHIDDVVRRFFNEAKAVNAIKHPGVVQVSDVGTASDGSLYLVMELLEGQTLTERLHQHSGKLSEEETLTICWQLAGVLSAAHAKNIIHRDLKPGNIMLVPDLAGPGGERVKLLDFGIAKLGAEHLQGDEIRTRTGQTLGTAAYMSPEQCTGDQAIGGQTDVYSLGVVMFRLLCGRLPFISTSGEMALGLMHMTKAPPAVTDFTPTVSPWLAGLVDRMLAKDAAARPTMAQVAGELQERLPARSSSRSLQPVAKATSSDVLYQEALEPTEDAPSDESAKGGPPTPAGPVRSRDAALLSGVPAAESSGQSGAGTITRATGQGISAPLRAARPRSLLLPVGVLTLLCLAAGTAWLLSSKPVTTLDPSAAKTANPAAAAQTSDVPAVSPAGAEPGAASPTPSAAASRSPSPSTVNEAKAQNKDAASGSGPGDNGKGARRASSAKKSERRKDDKSRRSPALKATPIMD